jgi:hypothetical protein
MIQAHLIYDLLKISGEWPWCIDTHVSTQKFLRNDAGKTHVNVGMPADNTCHSYMMAEMAGDFNGASGIVRDIGK